MRLRVSLFCLLISFAHHCHPDGERGAEVERGWGEGERERERMRARGGGEKLDVPRTLRTSLHFAVLYGTVHYFSTVHTQPLDPLWLYGLVAAVLLFQSQL